LTREIRRRDETFSGSEETDGTIRAEPLTMAASGDHVFVFQRDSGKRKGKALDIKALLLFTLADGVVSEVIECPSDYPATADFWS